MFDERKDENEVADFALSVADVTFSVGKYASVLPCKNEITNELSIIGMHYFVA